MDALNTAIGKVTGANAELYYQTDDHWNGKTYSEAGFWADMQTPLKAANDLLKAEKPKQDDVDTAAADLEAAIQKGRRCGMKEEEIRSLFELIMEDE